MCPETIAFVDSEKLSIGPRITTTLWWVDLRSGFHCHCMNIPAAGRRITAREGCAFLQQRPVRNTTAVLEVMWGLLAVR